MNHRADPPLPLIGLPSDSTRVGAHPFQAVGEKYLRAITETAGLPAIMIPSIIPSDQLDAVLDRLDGLLLTGSRSNIEPHHYSDEPSYPGNVHDPARDATTLSLVHRAIARGMPLLAVCRGMQEVNVALGGRLHQRVQDVPGLADHREREGDPLEVQYGPAHAVALTPGGILARLAGDNRAMVNSLHGQGVAHLAPGLVVEAFAPDGLIEAFRLADDTRFLLAVQWHPEWRASETLFYRATFETFADACRRFAQERRRVS